MNEVICTKHSVSVLKGTTGVEEQGGERGDQVENIENRDENIENS